MMDIPRDKTFSPTAVQCNGCGGFGCHICTQRGWLPAGHQHGRHCARDGCGTPIPPSQIAIYCSNECALLDA